MIIEKCGGNVTGIELLPALCATLLKEEGFFQPPSKREVPEGRRENFTLILYFKFTKTIHNIIRTH